jgi:hypothetical protein
MAKSVSRSGAARNRVKLTVAIIVLLGAGVAIAIQLWPEGAPVTVAPSEPQNSPTAESGASEPTSNVAPVEANRSSGQPTHRMAPPG